MPGRRAQACHHTVLVAVVCLAQEPRCCISCTVLTLSPCRIIGPWHHWPMAVLSVPPLQATNVYLSPTDHRRQCCVSSFAAPSLILGRVCVRVYRWGVCRYSPCCGRSPFVDFFLLSTLRCTIRTLCSSFGGPFVVVVFFLDAAAAGLHIFFKKRVGYYYKLSVVL